MLLRAETLMTPVAICTGEVRWVVSLVPSWPLLLLPMAQRVPSDFTKRAWEPPAATPMTSLAIGTGVLRLVVVPSPSWPNPL